MKIFRAAIKVKTIANNKIPRIKDDALKFASILKRLSLE